MNLYIVANSDGHVISSTDGTTWSLPFQTGIQIGKVAIAEGVIVYTRSDATESIAPQTGIYHTDSWNSTPTLAVGTDSACFNEVKYLNDKFVAVGFYNTEPRAPAFAYSEDGVNWTMGSLDPLYAEELGEGTKDIKFNDVATNGIGHLFVGSIEGDSLAGAFYTTDLTMQLGSENFVNPDVLPSDVNQLLYMESSGFSGWSAFSDDRKTWFLTTSLEPYSGWDFFELGSDVTSQISEELGLNSVITDAASGVSNGFAWWMLATSLGQIITWPHEPTGPSVQVLNPFTASVTSIVSMNPLRVTFSQNPLNNELITVEGSEGLENLNGSYFVKSVGENQYELCSDTELSSPINASSWEGSYINDSAAATFSHGSKIDAIGFGNGSFFAGTDLEEVFKTEDLTEENVYGDPIQWTKVDDNQNSFEYWNDVSFGYFGTDSSSSSSSEGSSSSESEVDSSSSLYKQIESCLDCKEKVACRRNKDCKCVKWNYVRGAWVPAVTMCDLNGQPIS